MPHTLRSWPRSVTNWISAGSAISSFRGSLGLLATQATRYSSPPQIDSVHDLFPPANWDERETYDMFGVVFNGHPELTRILMPDDWVGHPLRRDYPVGGEPVEFSEEHETWLTPPTEA